MCQDDEHGNLYRKPRSQATQPGIKFGLVVSKCPIEWCGFVVIVARIEGCAEFETEGGHRNVAFFGEAMERCDAEPVGEAGADSVFKKPSRVI